MGKWWLLSFLLVSCTTDQRGFPARYSIDNFDQVDQHLYRGAQPNNLGLRDLANMGVKTIINLRETNDVWVAEEKEVKSWGLSYTNIPMSGVRAPTKDQVRAILSVIEKSEGRVYVHCKYGCDRTGLIVSCYRIEHDGWPNEKALKEAREYGLSPWEFGMKAFIRRFRTDIP